jgi:uncharacterized membrane protein YfcA
MWILALICGIAFGVAFGLTGVGSVFAVPLLVYAIGLPPHQAVCVSMISVTALSALLTAWRWRGGEIEFRAGLIMAATGVAGAPVGAWLGRFLSGNWLMVVFAGVAALIAVRMIVSRREPSLPGAAALAAQGPHTLGLTAAGLTAGGLAGLFGIGGLLIVPSLVLLARIEIHRAIATSLLVVFPVGLSAIGSHWFAGQTVPPVATALFIAAGALGMGAGLAFGKSLPERRLQMVFGIVMLGMAVLIFASAIR